jgi:hypothetical protein
MGTKQASELVVGDHLPGIGDITGISLDEGKGDLAYVHVCAGGRCLLFRYETKVTVDDTALFVHARPQDLFALQDADADWSHWGKQHGEEES